MTEYISREDLLKKAKSSISVPADNEWDCGYNTAMAEMQEFIKQLPSADVQPVPQWISVKERLPNIGESVLVAVIINAKVNLPFRTDFTPELRIGWLEDNGEWGLQFDSADRDEILYWQPLPEPPQD